MKDYNEGRRARASSERRFKLCSYIFTRRAEVPLDVLTGFAEATAAAGPDSPGVITSFVSTFLRCVEPTAIVEATGEEVSSDDAWQQMTTIGDEYGPIGAETLAEVVQGLVSGTAEVPTIEPSDSPDGSPTPEDGTSSTVGSPLAEATSTT